MFGAIAAVLTVALALELSYLGYHQAQKTSHEVATADHKRALGQCSSSKELRDVLDSGRFLWERIDRIFIDPNTTREDLRAAHHAVERYVAKVAAYTGTNPNCINLPPKP